MAKRISLTGGGGLIYQDASAQEDERVDTGVQPTKIDALDIGGWGEYTQDTVNRIRLVSQFPARIIRTGLVSGEQYVWADAGSVVEVLPEDVESLLKLYIGEGVCCGPAHINYLFERL